MKAGYNFELDGNSYGDREVVVMADSYKEAEEKAKSLIDGSKLKLGKLRRVVDAEAQVTHQSIIERKLMVEEHHLKHSGEITEYKVKGEKKK